MDGLSPWTHCFATHLPLDQLSGFEYDAGADTCWYSNCHCPKFPWYGSFRAACLEEDTQILPKTVPSWISSCSPPGNQHCPRRDCWPTTAHWRSHPIVFLYQSTCSSIDSSFFSLKIYAFLQGYEKNLCCTTIKIAKIKKILSSVGKDVRKILISYWWEIMYYYTTWGRNLGLLTRQTIVIKQLWF